MHHEPFIGVYRISWASVLHAWTMVKKEQSGIVKAWPHRLYQSIYDAVVTYWFQSFGNFDSVEPEQPIEWHTHTRALTQSNSFILDILVFSSYAHMGDWNGLACEKAVVSLFAFNANWLTNSGETLPEATVWPAITVVQLFSRSMEISYYWQSLFGRYSEKERFMARECLASQNMYSIKY